MRDLLTPALAGVNPKAYIAHFKRLDDEARRAYLGSLSTPDLKTHFGAIGETATVGLVLTLGAAGPQLEATVGGAQLGTAMGPETLALQTRALELGRELESKAISGLINGASLSRLSQLEAALATVGWLAKTLVLAGDSGGDDCAPSLGWSMRGVIGETGTFYMPSEALVWAERAVVETMLRDLSARCGAMLDVRVG